MTRLAPIRVVGVGSPAGDDAVAWEVVRQLRQLQVWDVAIEFHAVEGGQHLLDILDGLGVLILIDALRAAEPPGTIRRMEWPDARLDDLRPATTHHLGPAEALQLAATLGQLPPRVVVWGIVGESFAPGSALSPPVAGAVPKLVRRIATEINAV